MTCAWLRCVQHARVGELDRANRRLPRRCGAEARRGGWHAACDETTCRKRGVEAEMSPTEPTQGTIVRTEVPWIAALVTFVGAMIALRVCSDSMDLRAVQSLPVAERSAFVHAECEALRALCTESEPPPTCLERARLVIDSGAEVEEQCGDLARSVARHRF